MFLLSLETQNETDFINNYIQNSGKKKLSNLLRLISYLSGTKNPFGNE